MSADTIIDPVTGTRADKNHGEMTVRIGWSTGKGTTEGCCTKEGAIMVQRQKRRDSNHEAMAEGTAVSLDGSSSQEAKEVSNVV